MSNHNDLWSDIGSLADEDAAHVLTRLFTVYEAETEVNPDSDNCNDFFKKLSTAISQITECNLNRR